MRKQKATVVEKNTGEIEIIYKGKSLEYTVAEKQPKVLILHDIVF